VEAPEVIDIGRNALFAMLKIGAPVMLVALVVGLIVSLIQALTQIQEMTLTFVPKMLAIVVALLIFLPFMLSSLTTFTQTLYDRIAIGS
jgi:flagellar biosynthetic protein FliQ